MLPPGVNFIKLWQNVNGKMCKVASRANFFHQISHISHMTLAQILYKKVWWNWFSKTSSLFVFRVKKSRLKMLMKSTPGNRNWQLIYPDWSIPYHCKSFLWDCNNVFSTSHWWVAGLKPLTSGWWGECSTTVLPLLPNGTARFRKCKQLFEYQHLLLLIDIWSSKF